MMAAMAQTEMMTVPAIQSAATARYAHSAQRQRGPGSRPSGNSSTVSPNRAMAGAQPGCSSTATQPSGSPVWCSR